MITGNEPAYPIQDTDEQNRLCSPKFGLTIRQHFAAMAMQGLLTEDSDVTSTWILEKLELPKDTPYELRHYMIYIAKQSVLAADALITELNKTK